MKVPGLPFKVVDRGVLEHAIERRGFVTVPLDRADLTGPTLDIFYRLIPANGATLDDTSKPIIVVINGGPGIASSFYRPLDYDYAERRMPRGGLDRFAFLLETHRVLIADQRGTDGQSAPLDMDDPSLDANLVARHFSSDNHALDYLAVIDAVVPADQRFFVIAQSYGGMPGMQLIAHADRRAPAGIVFSSSALPFEDPLAAMRNRRNEQLRLNLHLRDVVPDIAARVTRTRDHLSALGLDPNLVHGLFGLLGKDVSGVWEPNFVVRLATMCTQTSAQIMRDVEAGLEGPHLLNYILSSANFSPGWTDRTLAAKGSEEIAFEPWMIDEHVLLMQTGQDGGWQQRLVAAIDLAPPEPTPMPALATLCAGLARTQALFTAADNDAFVPSGGYHQAVSRFLVPGHTQVQTLPGGHNAIFLAAGHAALVAWSRTL